MGIGDRNRKKFGSWDEAFRGLIPVIRQESVRVADYTQVLFNKACTMPCYIKGSARPAFLFEEYAEVAYKCGFYHQIGKSLLPEDLQQWKTDYSEEERKLYFSYTADGRELVARLQGDAEDDEEHTTLSCLMIREACEQHMERWDGSGYPKGRERDEISLIAQIVGLAKALDNLVCGTRSENPFEEALGILNYKRGTWFSDNLIDTMKECRAELKEIYKKYIQYSQTVPKTVPLVEMRADRPFGLKYRPVRLNGNLSNQYEAVPWFKGVAEEEGQLITMKQVEGAMERTGLLRDVGLYLLYEAADTLLRLYNWGVDGHALIVHMFAGFYRDPTVPERLEQFFKDQPIAKKRLRLTISGRFLDQAAPFQRMGIPFLLNGYRPEQIHPSQLLDAGFDYVRISKKITDPEERAQLTEELMRYGVTIVESDEAEVQLAEEDWVHQL